MDEMKTYVIYDYMCMQCIVYLLNEEILTIKLNGMNVVPVSIH